MNEELVENYYKKMLHYSKEYKTSKYIKDNEKEMKDYLRKITETNNIHILTDSVLCHIVKAEFTVYYLKLFCSNNLYYRNASLCNYYTQIVICLTNSNLKNRCFKLLDDNTRSIFYAIFYYDSEINDIEEYNYRTQFICMLIITLSYCHINNRLQDFSNLYKQLFDNKNLLIEDIKLNKVFNRERLEERTISLLENIDNKKIIR